MTMMRGFSTVACGDATFAEVIRWAKECNMQAIEIRLDKNNEICGLTREELVPYLQELKEAGIIISDLGSNITLGPYMSEKVERLKKIVELASFVGAKGIRLFLGRYISRKDQITLEDTPDVIRFLKETAGVAREKGVELWIENHYSYSACADVRPLLDAVGEENVKVLWDILHSTEFNESPEAAIGYVGSEIAHVHIKNGRPAEDPGQLTFDHTDMFDGIVPIREVLQVLKKINYQGSLSLEWESMWHPELASMYPDIPTLLNAYHRYLDENQ